MRDLTGNKPGAGEGDDITLGAWTVIAFFAISVFATLVSAYRSGSTHIFNAALILAAIWAGSNLAYFMRIVWGISDIGIWRFTVFHIAAIIYFYFRWSAKNAQHRTFHLLILWTFIIKVAFYAYQLWVTSYTTSAIGISAWWYQFIMNALFELSLILVFGYGLLFRKAQMDKGKYRNDVDKWFASMGKVRKNIVSFFTKRRNGADKPHN